jgi:hypothetical protein
MDQAALGTGINYEPLWVPCVFRRLPSSSSKLKTQRLGYLYSNNKEGITQR